MTIVEVCAVTSWDSIEDIERSLQNDYPKHLRYKLYYRLLQCYFHLQLYEKLNVTFKDFKLYLRQEISGLSQELKDESLKLAQAIIKKVPANHENVNFPLKDESIVLPQFKNGENKRFLCASSAIDLKYSSGIGRHVLANRDIEYGEVLFIEKAYSFVPKYDSDYILQQSSLPIKCHSCFKTCRSPISCDHCTVLYCNEQCRDVSWDLFHQWECAGYRINFWFRKPVLYMGFRLMILGAHANFIENNSSVPENYVKDFGSKDNNYPFAYSFVSHYDKIDNCNMFMYCAHAMAVVLYLTERTNFFNWLQEKFNIYKTLGELQCFIGGIILKHLLQAIVYNASIEVFPSTCYEKFDKNEKIFIDMLETMAFGTYISYSMLCHSCNPNVTYSHIDDYVIVKAKFDIKKGEQIYISYNCEYQEMSNAAERQDKLLKQYHFVCNCRPCTDPSFFYERDGLLCPKCQGCAAEEKPDFHKCLNCLYLFPNKNHNLHLQKADALHKKYSFSKNVKYLIECLSLQEKVLYKFNQTLFNTLKDIANHYSATNEILKFWEYQTLMLSFWRSQSSMKGSLTLAMKVRNNVCFAIEFLNMMRTVPMTLSLQRAYWPIVQDLAGMIDEQERIYRVFYPDDKINFNAIRTAHANILSGFSKCT